MLLKFKENEMAEEFDETAEIELTADEAALLENLPELSELGEGRRKFLGQAAALGLGAFALDLLAREQAFAAIETPPEAVFAPVQIENGVKVAMKINGAEKIVNVDSRMTLLDTLRERLELTGSKKGCDHGQCGACTVIVDGRRVLSCLTLAASCEGKSVTTIEGLANGDALHPMQAAFIKHDGFQCGYCTPGQICSAVALMNEAKNGEASYVSTNIRANAKTVKLSDDEIRERMSGNICRCGAYPNIVKAIQEIHSGRETAQSWSFYKSDETAAVNQEDEKDATV
jgi:xanthine dehydrogenase YagT iron-sulfur-binding subunit